jgi:hypothetical protein
MNGGGGPVQVKKSNNTSTSSRSAENGTIKVTVTGEVSFAHAKEFNSSLSSNETASGKT